MSRYAPYPPEWDDEPEFPEEVQQELDEEAAAQADQAPFELPDGRPADDVHHAVAADVRDLFLHPDRDDQ